MVNDIMITRSAELNASPERVWEALTHPKMTKEYLYNCEVQSDWRPGSSLRWSGNYKGRALDEEGTILEIIPGRMIKYSGLDSLLEGNSSGQGNVFITHEIIPYGNKTKLLTTLEHFEGDEARAEYVAYQWDLEIMPRLQSIVETTL